mmetsp:Transcript_29785/g.94950  ORF Transcript_29785/g.94950 Transcript_29785/m.94950 type:complete len:297 (+) Transcript_29785:590-1480(+)
MVRRHSCVIISGLSSSGIGLLPSVIALAASRAAFSSTTTTFWPWKRCGTSSHGAAPKRGSSALSKEAYDPFADLERQQRRVAARHNTALQANNHQGNEHFQPSQSAASSCSPTCVPEAALAAPGAALCRWSASPAPWLSGPAGLACPPLPWPSGAPAAPWPPLAPAPCLCSWPPSAPAPAPLLPSRGAPAAGGLAAALGHSLEGRDRKPGDLSAGSRVRLALERAFSSSFAFSLLLSFFSRLSVSGTAPGTREPAGSFSLAPELGSVRAQSSAGRGSNMKTRGSLPCEAAMVMNVS